MENETKKEVEITDDEAVALLNSTNTIGQGRFGTIFVPRTILYVVEVEYKPGVKTREIRTFVTQYSYTTERRWAKAQEIEKKFKKLNAEYAAALTAKGKPVNVKEPVGRRGTPVS